MRFLNPKNVSKVLASKKYEAELYSIIEKKPSFFDKILFFFDLKEPYQTKKVVHDYLSNENYDLEKFMQRNKDNFNFDVDNNKIYEKPFIRIRMNNNDVIRMKFEDEADFNEELNKLSKLFKDKIEY